jgi:hypothetical protein
MKKLLTIAATALLLFGVSPSAARAAETSALSEADAKFFKDKVYPILKSHCLRCHSHESGKAKGGLVLDSREAILKGGATGPAVVPKDTGKSLLLKAVSHKDASFAMPPDEKLPEEDIAILTEWVKRGAPDPRVPAKALPGAKDILAKAESHWAFQKVKAPTLPSVSDPWINTPIDRLVFAKMQEKGLTPAALADKRTLIRRLSYDLRGLPPTPEEVDAFVKDSSKDAYEKLLDRYLDSTAYAERWARHWLDVARYSDTYGEQARRGLDNRFPFAYTYRDYVIDSFHKDKPFNQFIVEQLAADRLPESKKEPEKLAALGFLTVGKRFDVADDILDDRIDVVTRGLMGLSVACARCHDHKFDPIPTKDYYSLFGVFSNSVEPQILPVIKPGAKAGSAEYEKLLEKANAELHAYENAKWTEWEMKNAPMVGSYLAAARQVQNNKTGGISAGQFFRQKALSPRIAQRLRPALTQAGRKHDPITSLINGFFGISDADAASKYPAIVKFIRAGGDAKRPVNSVLVEAFKNATDPQNFADVAKILDSMFGSIDAAWRKELAKNPKAEALPEKDQEAVRQWLYGPTGLLNREFYAFAGEIGLREDGQRNRLLRKRNDVMMYHAAAPIRAMTLEDVAAPRDANVFIRGERANKGPVVARQFLEVLSGKDRKPFSDGSGRLDLARAIANNDNPLTARVIVNRVWAWHFGTGIVPTPSDFGLMGQPPSNPALLDHLAEQFMADGWSLKRLHKRILLSSVYRQSSEGSATSIEKDPNNIYLSRMNRRRVEFEPLRDSILALSGRLDLSVGGRAVDGLRSDANRRAIYSVIDRYELPATFTTFDFADPTMTSPERFRTTVPQQSLFLMNSPFVIENAKRMVAGKDFLALSEEDKVRDLIRRIFQREPSKDDLADALEFIKTQSTASETNLKSPWLYGTGDIDPTTKKLRIFRPIPRFVKNEYRVEAPKQNSGVMRLTAEGGQAGKTRFFSPVRRWVSPIDGVVTISGSASTSSKGGLRASIVDSVKGTLLGVDLKDGSTETAVKRLEVKKGQTVDFVATSLTPNETEFAWKVTILQIELDPKDSKGDHEWVSKDDFSGPETDAPKTLTAWEKYAQVLLLTNEFVYID